MRFQSQARFWLFVLLIFVLLVWILRPVLLPFVAGTAIAYFLAPVVNELAHKRVPRWLGTLLVLSGFVVIVGLIGTLILPMIVDQVTALIDAVPGYVETVRTNYLPWIQTWLHRIHVEGVSKLPAAAGQSAGEVAGWLGNVAKQVVLGGVALIDALAIAIIMPVTAFFVLRDWPKLTETIDSMLPRRYYDVIHSQLEEIDRTLSGFIRGQALVCLALGLIYSIGLTLIGLDYGVAIGVTAGVLSFIPFVGTTFGWLASVILACVQFGDWSHVGMVAGVFLFGNIMESYVLTPRLVGNRVGLHPIWILFALITGGKLMGFLGILIAVPTAAVIGVLVRFLARQYKGSAAYKDILQ